MKEYGGYIEFEKYYNQEYHKDALALNTGTNCLVFLLRNKRIKKVYLPYFMCPTAGKACKENNIETEFYHIDESFRPIFKTQMQEGEYIYVVNYYGQIDNEEISRFKAVYVNIIIDNVQAFFQLPLPGIDTIYSCRKFFGVPDGAYLYTDLEHETPDIEQDYSFARLRHLAGRFETTGTTFLEQYRKNEKELLKSPVLKMSKCTSNLLRGIDYKSVLNIRNINFQYLYDRLQERNGLALKLIEGAYMYPFFVPNGWYIRKKLCDIHIYIPLLWPDVVEKCRADSVEYKLAQNILPLPVDQRYNIKDMDYIYHRVLELLRDH